MLDNHILIVGPSKAGKTTMLYSLLKYRNYPKVYYFYVGDFEGKIPGTNSVFIPFSLDNLETVRKYLQLETQASKPCVVFDDLGLASETIDSILKEDNWEALITSSYYSVTPPHFFFHNRFTLLALDSTLLSLFEESHLRVDLKPYMALVLYPSQSDLNRRDDTYLTLSTQFSDWLWPDNEFDLPFEPIFLRSVNEPSESDYDMMKSGSESDDDDFCPFSPLLSPEEPPLEPKEECPQISAYMHPEKPQLKSEQVPLSDEGLPAFSIGRPLTSKKQYKTFGELPKLLDEDEKAELVSVLQSDTGSRRRLNKWRLPDTKGYHHPEHPRLKTDFYTVEKSSHSSGQPYCGDKSKGQYMTFKYLGHTGFGMDTFMSTVSQQTSKEFDSVMRDDYQSLIRTTMQESLREMGKSLVKSLVSELVHQTIQSQVTKFFEEEGEQLIQSVKFTSDEIRELVMSSLENINVREGMRTATTEKVQKIKGGGLQEILPNEVMDTHIRKETLNYRIKKNHVC